jgi:hypothetical protein
MECEFRTGTEIALQETRQRIRFLTIEMQKLTLNTISSSGCWMITMKHAKHENENKTTQHTLNEQ